METATANRPWSTAEAEQHFPIGSRVTDDEHPKIVWLVIGHWRGYVRCQEPNHNTSCCIDPRHLTIAG